MPKQLACVVDACVVVGGLCMVVGVCVDVEDNSNCKVHRFYYYHHTPKHYHLFIVKNRQGAITRAGFGHTCRSSVQL